MNWFTNHYFREGPGIDRNAPKPKGLRLLLSVLGREWWELLKLNLLFILFSLPLVTLPAASFALVWITVTMIEDRNVWLFRDFWTAFRLRFWLTTGLGLVFAAIAGLDVLALKTYAAAAQDNLVFALPLAIAIAVMIALPLYGMHLLVALAKGKNRRFRTIAKAAGLGLLARPLPGLFALLFVALLWLVHIAFYPASVFMPVLVNFSLGALVMSFAALKGVLLGFSHLAAHPQNGTTGKPEIQSA